MEPRRWEEIQVAFHELAELDGAERQGRLEALEATDPDLRSAVEALLAADGEADEELAGIEAGLVAAEVNPVERIATSLAGRYEVERELGSGGMATVFLARDVKHHRRVALKVLKPDLAATLGPERFLREIAVTARLDHPHILPLLDSGEAGGLLYYVMPYVEGESLRDRLDREKQLPLDDCLEITHQVADALGYAHSHGIIHRDIKPGNILLGDGHARVADLGIARAAARAGEDGMTETGVAVGTPLYMSPEQAAGDRALDARSDVYSLGCVVYEMLAGQPPYTGATAEAILARKSLEAVPSLRVVRETVPEGVEEAITRALAKAPADRFASVAQFVDALERGRVRRSRVSRRHVVLGAAAVVLTVVASTWALPRLQPRSDSISSLAVLPFKNLMGDSAQTYFVEGMQDALTTELSKLGVLTVISRSSAMHYQNSDKTMPQIARELHVDGLIEGSVLREGNQVRITVELIHEPSDRHIWANSYQRELRNILTLQADVARAIANQIQLKLTPAAEARLTNTSTIDPDAYEAYLRARFFFNRWPASEYTHCVEYYERSIRLAPTWAAAHAGLASCYSYRGWDTRPKDVMPRARVAAQNALALDPNQAEAIVALAWVNMFYDWNWEAAGQNARRALELDPNSATAHMVYSNYLVFTGVFPEAIREAQRAMQLDPGSLLMNRGLAFVYQLSRRYRDYAAQARVTLDLAPDNVVAKFDVAWAAALQGHRDTILAELKDFQLVAAVVLATLGEREPALAPLKTVEGDRRQYYVDAFWIAATYAALNEADDAFRWLDTAYAERSASMAQLKTNQAFDPVRHDPRFRELMRRMNFPD